MSEGAGLPRPRRVRAGRSGSEGRPDGPWRELLLADPVLLALGRRPLATSRIRSKRRRPTLSTGSPSRIGPASRSMSSIIRSYIGVLVATLMHGVGLRPSTLPRPVVKTRTLAPPAIRPGRARRVVAGGVHEDQARLVDPRGIGHDVHQGRRSGLGQGAQRLLVDRREAAGLVAGRGVVVDLGAEDRRCTTPTT